MTFDGIEVHRPSNHDTEITTAMLNELYDYTKKTLNVSVTFSGTRHANGKAINIPVTRTLEQLNGKPFIFINRLPIILTRSAKRQASSRITNAREIKNLNSIWTMNLVWTWTMNLVSTWTMYLVSTIERKSQILTKVIQLTIMSR